MLLTRRLALAASVLLTTGCATTGTMRSAPADNGIARTFTGEYDKVLKASREAVVEAGLAIEEVNKVDDRTWMIIGKKGASAWSWGEMVRVLVQQTGPSETTVRVYTQRKLATNVTAKGDYSSSILSNVELKLRTGGP
jgi:hypothetical protein